MSQLNKVRARSYFLCAKGALFRLSLGLIELLPKFFHKVVHDYRLSKESFMKSSIRSIEALQILDSRGHPTIAVEVTLEDGTIGESAVPSGASTGEFEAIELRDGNCNYYHGKGVLKAVSNVNDRIAYALKGMNALELSVIDSTLVELDGTANKENLGANATLGASLAVAHAAANYSHLPLFEYLGKQKEYLIPVPLINVINGGAHANNSLDIQEFMLVPHGAPTFAEALRYGSEIFHALGDLLQDDGYDTAVGDEGGYAPRFESTELTLDFLMQAIERAGYKPGRTVSLALDVAASELVDDSDGRTIYVFSKSTQEKYKANELISLYERWLQTYPIVSIEDGLGENDWSGWKELTSRLSSRVQLVGDDLFVTNPRRIDKGIQEQIANAVLIKLNQIGTLTETLQAIDTAGKGGYRSIVSHRSGETSDTSIADLAVACRGGQIKTGSVCRGERTAKYNRLLWIEAKLGERGQYARPFETKREA